MEARTKRKAWGLGLAVLIAIAALATTAAAASRTPPSIECLPLSSTFGDPISCTVAGVEDAQIDWGDSTHKAIEAERSPVVVGEQIISLLNSEGEWQAETTVTIAPDLAIDCDEGSLVLPVYELIPADGVSGFTYVFVDEAGERVHPGDANYPDSLVSPDLDRHQIGEGVESGICQASSHAADALDGKIHWVTETDWQNPQKTAMSFMIPSSKWDWEGTQPGWITATADVMGETVSERRGVFLSGCG